MTSKKNELCKLRLVLFTRCNRVCEGCCNQDWDLGKFPVCTDFTGYNQILLTGGEPMLNPNLVVTIAKKIRAVTDAKVYLYTAKVDDLKATLRVLDYVDGMTVTLHTQEDVFPFLDFNSELQPLARHHGKSMRLNIFQGVWPDSDPETYPFWDFKTQMQWIKNCPLPENEVLMLL